MALVGAKPAATAGPQGADGEAGDPVGPLGRGAEGAECLGGLGTPGGGPACTRRMQANRACVRVWV